MKIILAMIILTLSLISADKKQYPKQCLIIEEKISFYEKIEESKKYTGDFNDVIDKLNDELEICIKKDYEYKSPFRKATQQKTSDGGLF